MLSFWRAISIYGSAEEYFPKWSHHYFCREEFYIYEKNELIPGLGFLLFRKKHIMHIKCWKKKKHNRKEGYSTELKSLNHLSKPSKDQQITRDNDFTSILKDRIHSFKEINAA